jgi:hypothetical protein
MVAGHIYRRSVLHALGEDAETGSLTLRAHLAVPVRLVLVFQETLELGSERLRGLQLGTVHDFPRTLNGRNVIFRFKRDEAPTAVYLFGEPVSVAAQIDAFDSPLEHADMLVLRP